MKQFDQNSQKYTQVQTLFPNGLSTFALRCTQSNLTCITKGGEHTKILSEDAQNRPHVTRSISNIHNELYFINLTFRSNNLTIHSVLTT